MFVEPIVKKIKQSYILIIMKKSFLVFFVFSISLNFFAQGIAVQGIARDNASSAIPDTPLNFTFSITQDDNTVLYVESQPIRTDNYGVFSHIVKNGNPVNGAVFSTIDFSIQNLKMKVSVNYNSTDIEVYDQPFQYTPYAHFAANAANAENAENAENAANGVPTGSIISFIGGNVNSAPSGWVKCEGQDLSPTSENAALIALVGTKAPDLRGLFLRGTGTNSVINSVGPALKTYQDDTLEAHQHGVTITVNAVGNHNHAITRLPQDLQANGSGDMMALVDSGAQDESWAPVSGGNSATSDEGQHNHTATGDIASTGSFETRPANFGVVYIIKL
jgi:microcystin-dependent protein